MQRHPQVLSLFLLGAPAIGSQWTPEASTRTEMFTCRGLCLTWASKWALVGSQNADSTRLGNAGSGPRRTCIEPSIQFWVLHPPRASWKLPSRGGGGYPSPLHCSPTRSAIISFDRGNDGLVPLTAAGKQEELNRCCNSIPGDATPGDPCSVWAELASFRDQELSKAGGQKGQPHRDIPSMKQQHPPHTHTCMSFRPYLWQC